MANKKKNKGVAPVDKPMKMFTIRQKLDIIIFILVLYNKNFE